jgi:hypothetical protein
MFTAGAVAALALQLTVTEGATLVAGHRVFGAEHCKRYLIFVTGQAAVRATAAERRLVVLSQSGRGQHSQRQQSQQGAEWGGRTVC